MKNFEKSQITESIYYSKKSQNPELRKNYQEFEKSQNTESS